MNDKKYTILFIEDEESLQKTLSDALVNEGFKILNAFDGESGLKMASKQKPDLILLDLILPKMDGFKVLGQLKKQPETANIPVIVLTNLETTPSIEKTLELGATTYLVKANYELFDVIKKIKDNLPDWQAGLKK